MRKQKSKFSLKDSVRLWFFTHSKLLRIAFMMIIMAVMLTTVTLAVTPPATTESDTIWAKAKEIMQDVYSQIILISTIAAVVTAAIALLLMNFSKNSKTVDESRAWLKRIIISWAILNGLGFIMAYVTPFFAGGEWTE
jgi:uncharacterized membrane protein